MPSSTGLADAPSAGAPSAPASRACQASPARVRRTADGAAAAIITRADLDYGLDALEAVVETLDKQPATV